MGTTANQGDTMVNGEVFKGKRLMAQIAAPSEVLAFSEEFFVREITLLRLMWVFPAVSRKTRLTRMVLAPLLCACTAARGVASGLGSIVSTTCFYIFMVLSAAHRPYLFSVGIRPVSIGLGKLLLVLLIVSLAIGANAAIVLGTMRFIARLALVGVPIGLASIVVKLRESLVLSAFRAAFVYTEVSHAFNAPNIDGVVRVVRGVTSTAAARFTCGPLYHQTPVFIG